MDSYMNLLPGGIPRPPPGVTPGRLPPSLTAPSQVGYPFRYDWTPWPQPPFTYAYPTPVPCGPINDPYCPHRLGTVGLPDIFGYPTCCCARSGKCHTPSVVPVGDEPVGIVTYPLGPYALYGYGYNN